MIEPVLPTILLENELDRPLHDDFAALARTVCDDLWTATPSSAIDRFRTFWAGAEALPQISPALRLRMIEAADKLVFDFAAILGEQDVLTAARTIKVPTLLFSGGLSPELTRRIAHRLAATIPNAQLEHLPGAGHLMAISHAATLNPKIAQHIRQVEALTGWVANMSATASAPSVS